jgi:Putative Ig domain
VSRKPLDDDALSGVELSRRDLIRRLVLGTAFAVPVVASFEMSSLSVSSASAYGPNQFGTAPAIKSGAAATFAVGQAGPAFTVTTTGTPIPSITEAGQLPGGVTLTDNGDGTATLNGTPAGGTGGVYDLTITVSNAYPPNATQSFALTVNEAPSFSTAAATALSTAQPGSFAIATNGYPPATIAESGGLPNGVSFAANAANGTALLAGKPSASAAGVHEVTLTAGNGISPEATQTLAIVVAEPVSFVSAATVSFAVGSAGHFAVVAAGFPAPSLSEQGKLPSGVTFTDDGNGTATLAGTPTKGSQGTYPLAIVGTAAGSPAAAQALTLSVLAPAKPAPSNEFTVSHIKVSSAGAITFKIKVPGPGAIEALVTAWDDNVASSAALQPATGRFKISHVDDHAKHAETISIKTTPNAVGRRLIRNHTYRITLRLYVTFTPTGGSARSKGFGGLHLP